MKGRRLVDNDNAMMDMKKIPAQSFLAAVYRSFLCACIQSECNHSLVYFA
jgi:hypothetical protein